MRKYRKKRTVKGWCPSCDPTPGVDMEATIWIVEFEGELESIVCAVCRHIIFCSGNQGGGV
jgi:hypothetical protein